MTEWSTSIERKVFELSKAIADAVVLLEARWTLSALRRVNPDLAQRLAEQRELWHVASLTGDEDDIELQGRALCRGYAAAVRAMEAAQEADDAYLVGQCHRTGFRIAIGHQKASAGIVGRDSGEPICHFTPDELAAVLAALEGFRPLAALKIAFPGAEVVKTHRNEPAQGDSYPLEAAE